MDFLQKYFNGAFELPYRETPKNVLEKISKKKSAGGWVWDLANVRGDPSIIFWRLLALQVASEKQGAAEGKKWEVS
jgi:hypothetical protein